MPYINGSGSLFFHEGQLELGEAVAEATFEVNQNVEEVSTFGEARDLLIPGEREYHMRIELSEAMLAEAIDSLTVMTDTFQRVHRAFLDVGGQVRSWYQEANLMDTGTRSLHFMGNAMDTTAGTGGDSFTMEDLRAVRDQLLAADPVANPWVMSHGWPVAQEVSGASYTRRSLMHHDHVHAGFDPDATWTDEETVPDEITDERREQWRREAFRDQTYQDDDSGGGITIDELLGDIDLTLDGWKKESASLAEPEGEEPTSE